MSSVVTDFKQSHGYFITTGTGCVGYYQSAAGSGAGGSFVQPVMTPLTASQLLSTQLALAVTILRDMGKTVLVGGIANSAGSGSTAGTTGVPTRVFRKVQLLNTSRQVASTAGAANVANGVDGSSAENATNGNMYFTFYVELPTLGRSGHTSNTVAQPLAYVNSLPGLYV